MHFAIIIQYFPCNLKNILHANKYTKPEKIHLNNASNILITPL